ncbi:hypothetical protein PENTCL1PPCAC_23998, partial [Pristionchus entomophagus]
KQVLIHFTSTEHCEKETAAVRNSGFGSVRKKLLNSITDLPLKMAKEDAKLEQDRLKRIGKRNLLRPDGSLGIQPNPMIYCEIALAFEAETIRLNSGQLPSSLISMTETLVRVVKSDVGRKMMAELHEHLGKAPTYCTYCECLTGDRDGFYTHFVSSFHLKGAAKSLKGHGPESDVLTFIVNVLRNDLV